MEGESDREGKGAFIGSFTAILQGTAPTRNHSQFAIPALLPTDLTFRPVWVVSPYLEPITDCCFSVTIFSNEN